MRSIRLDPSAGWSARRYPHQKGTLLTRPPERSEDRSRRRKKLPPESEPFSGLPHDFFKAVSGDAVNVQRATEPQHEADRVARPDDRFVCGFLMWRGHSGYFRFQI